MPKEYPEESFYSYLLDREEYRSARGFTEALEKFNGEKNLGVNMENLLGASSAFWIDTAGEGNFRQAFLYNDMWDAQTNLKHTQRYDIDTFIECATGKDNGRLYIRMPDNQFLHLKYDSNSKKLTAEDPFAFIDKPRDLPDEAKPNIFKRAIHALFSSAWEKDFEKWEKAKALDERVKAATTVKESLKRITTSPNFKKVEKNQKEYAQKQMEEKEAAVAQASLQNEQPKLEESQIQKGDNLVEYGVETTRGKITKVDRELQTLFQKMNEYHKACPPESPIPDMGDFILMNGVPASEGMRKRFKPEKNTKSYEEFTATSQYRKNLAEQMVKAAMNGHQVEVYAPGKGFVLPQTPQVLTADDQSISFAPAPEGNMTQPAGLAKMQETAAQLEKAHQPPVKAELQREDPAPASLMGP